MSDTLLAPAHWRTISNVAAAAEAVGEVEGRVCPTDALGARRYGDTEWPATSGGTPAT